MTKLNPLGPQEQVPPIILYSQRPNQFVATTPAYKPDSFESRHEEETTPSIDPNDRFEPMIGNPYGQTVGSVIKPKQVIPIIEDICKWGGDAWDAKDAIDKLINWKL